MKKIIFCIFTIICLQGCYLAGLTVLTSTLGMYKSHVILKKKFERKKLLEKYEREVDAELKAIFRTLSTEKFDVLSTEPIGEVEIVNRRR